MASLQIDYYKVADKIEILQAKITQKDKTIHALEKKVLYYKHKASACELTVSNFVVLPYFAFSEIDWNIFDNHTFDLSYLFDFHFRETMKY